MTPAITIVIPNFNGAQLLQKNLPSVIRAAEHYGNATISVVDDGSKDTSVAVIQASFPQVRLLRHAQNRGFSEAILTGVNAAESEYVFLLNSDVEVAESCLKFLVQYFEQPDTFAVCPLIYEENGEVNRHSWNVRRYSKGALRAQSWQLEQALQQVKTRRLPNLYTSGGSMLVRRSMFLALGGFHPIYKPFYGEDYDLGLRAWRQGWRSYFEPRTSVVHQSQGSIKDNVKRAYVKQIRRRNKYLLEWIHTPALRLWCSVLPLSLWQLLGELILMDGVNVRGFFNALARLPQAIKVRRELQATQKIAIRDVLAQF